MRKVKQQQPTGKGEQLGILFHQARHIERELPRKPSETEGKNPPPPGAGKSQSDTGTAITLNLCIQAGVTLAWRWCDNPKTLPPPPKKKKKKKGKGGRVYSKYTSPELYGDPGNDSPFYKKLLSQNGTVTYVVE